LSCGRVKPAFAIAATSADRLEFVMDLATCENPIFIIGSPRSGTSILAWSLAEHSQLEVFAESNFLDLPD
jgi:sulfotransferase family protein